MIKAQQHISIQRESN